MDELVISIVTAFGGGPTIAVAIVAGLGFVATVLNAVWSDDDMPPVVRKIITLLSGSVGHGANDPEAQ